MLTTSGSSGLTTLHDRSVQAAQGIVSILASTVLSTTPRNSAMDDLGIRQPD